MEGFYKHLKLKNMEKKAFVPLDAEKSFMPIEGLELFGQEDAFLVVGGGIDPPKSRYSYLNLFRRSYPCKTSVHNQLAISYDGKIYKCTGRNFTDEMQEGILQTEGTIAWDTEKWEKRMAICSFDNELCRGCKLLPLCWAPCNQKLLEAGNSVKSIKHFCQKNQLEMSLEDYIRFRFNSEILNDKYHEKESV